MADKCRLNHVGTNKADVAVGDCENESAECGRAGDPLRCHVRLHLGSVVNTGHHLYKGKWQVDLCRSDVPRRTHEGIQNMSVRKS